MPKKTKREYTLDKSIGFKTEIAEQMIKRDWLAEMRKNEIDVTSNQWVVLNRLKEEEGLTQSELARRTFKDTANITHIIDLMVKRDLVKRVTVESDRRAFNIFLTEKGKSMLEIMPQIVLSVLDRATKGIPRKDVEVTMSVLSKIIANLNKDKK